MPGLNRPSQSPENRALRNRKNAATANGRANRLLHTAKRRGLECTITQEWIRDKLEQPCPRTGWVFDLSTGSGRNLKSPSLDQIEPGKGYTPENTQVVCWGYNAAKSTGTDADVVALAEAILNVRTRH